MNFKKIFAFTFILFAIFSITKVNAVTNINELNISSPVAILIECETGKVLYEKDAYEKKYPASTTKIMTAILAIENCDLDEKVTVSRDAVYQVPWDYTNANLQIGEVLSVRDLLYAFMIPSANDCGYVLAEYIAGSTEKFADMMNKKAKEIGCKNTNFMNPSGIHNENHYSTAYDLALIGRYAMKNNIFREIVSTQRYTLPATEKYDKTDRIFVNSNLLIRESQPKYYYEYATGVKTGYTDQSRDCVVASAKKDGVEYIAVILEAGYTENWLKEKYLDSKTLFEYAFDNYTTKNLALQGKVFDTIKISGATSETKNLNVTFEKDINAFIDKENTNDFSPIVSYKEDLKAPISKGDIIGTISYDVDGIIYTSNLIAENDVQKSHAGIITLAIILSLFILINSIRFYNYRKKMKRKNYRKKSIFKFTTKRKKERTLQLH